MEETQAIHRLKRGELTGLEFLVRKHQAKAVYAAYLVLQDRQLAEDVVQNAFLRIYDRIRQFDENRPFEPWFIRIVVNAALDTAKKGNRWISLETDPDKPSGIEVDWLKSDAPSPQDLVETAEIRQTVRQSLRKLNAEQRAAIVLRYFLEMNETEMSAALHKPTSTIRWRLHEARRNLKELLRTLYQSPDEPHEE